MNTGFFALPGKMQENRQEKFVKVRSKRPKKPCNSLLSLTRTGQRPALFPVRAVMSCCGARNSLLSVRSQNFDRCHTSPSLDSATGGSWARLHFDIAVFSHRCDYSSILVENQVEKTRSAFFACTPSLDHADVGTTLILCLFFCLSGKRPQTLNSQSLRAPAYRIRPQSMALW